MHGAFAGSLKPAGVFSSNAGNQDAVLAFKQFGGDPDDLNRRLAGAEDDLGKSFAQSTVRIDLGETEVGDRRSLKFAEHSVTADAARAKLFQQFDGFRCGHALTMPQWL
jgi:hypothetical protein